MAMAIRWKLKFGNGEWQWPFSGNGIFGSVNDQILQVAIFFGRSFTRIELHISCDVDTGRLLLSREIASE